jgi:hypothetical protein
MRKSLLLGLVASALSLSACTQESPVGPRARAPIARGAHDVASDACQYFHYTCGNGDDTPCCPETP